eukprot:scaffold216355_cov32-Tisochrysis_lutea.AAC.2
MKEVASSTPLPGERGGSGGKVGGRGGGEGKGPGSMMSAAALLSYHGLRYDRAEASDLQSTLRRANRVLGMPDRRMIVYLLETSGVRNNNCSLNKLIALDRRTIACF